MGVGFQDARGFSQSFTVPVVENTDLIIGKVPEHQTQLLQRLRSMCAILFSELRKKRMSLNWWRQIDGCDKDSWHLGKDAIYFFRSRLQINDVQGAISLSRGGWKPKGLLDAFSQSLIKRLPLRRECIQGIQYDSPNLGNINVSDISNRPVTAVYVAGTGTYSYTSTNGNAVIDYSALGLPANAFQIGQNVLVDPTSGNLSGQVYTSKAITAVTATTFTVSYGTGFTTGTGSIAMIGIDVPIGSGAGQVPASLTGAFVVNHPAGRYAGRRSCP